MISVINPMGDFPLNDDWSYGRAVKTLLEKGRLQFTDWTGMTLIAQVLWGYLFCLPLGFSFTALRISTLTLGMAGILGTYGLLKESGTGPRTAFLGAMVMAVNPLYYSLSFTFMTDIPFFTLGMLSLYFFIQGLRTEKKSKILAGFFLATLAMLIRQLGIVIPIAFGIVYLTKYGLKKRSIAMALVPMLLSGGMLILYQHILKSTIGLPELYQIQSRQIPDIISKGIFSFLNLTADRGLIAFIYSGLFLLPFSVVQIQDGIPCDLKNSRLYLTLGSCALALAVFVMGICILRNRFIPLCGNILYDFGLGPLTLRDTNVMELDHLPKIPRILWMILTGAGAAGGAALLYCVLSSVIQRCQTSGSDSFKKWDWLSVFILSLSLLYFLPVGIVDIFFDRYLLFLLPLIMMMALRKGSSNGTGRHTPAHLLSISTIIVFGLFSMGATHDYLSWNRARWKALHYLTEDLGIPRKKIDGGFEFNGFYLFDDTYPFSKKYGVLWLGRQDDYVISFGPSKGYEMMKRFPYQRWILWERGYILILKKIRPS